MSDDPLDPTLHALARRARAEVERGIDDANVEAALRETIGDGRLNVPLTATRTTRSSTRTWSTLAAAASVVAVVVGAAYLLLGRDEQISTQLPPSSQAAVPVTAASPDTTFTVLATTTVPASTSPSTSSTSTTSTTTTTTLTATSTSVPTYTGAVITSIDEVPYERYLSDAQCLEDDCAQIAFGSTGVAWTFQNGALTNHARGGATVELPEPWRSVGIRDIFLIAIGPDDVAYFSVFQASESADLVGISIAPADAGQAVVVLEGAVDFSGDTDYVPTPDGLAKVGCCGFDEIRPAPDAELLVEWLARAADNQPLPDVTFDVANVTISRGASTWALDVDPQLVMARGMPEFTATHDGGVIGVLVGLDTESFVVRGWPDGTSSIAAVSFDVFLRSLTPEGFVMSATNDGFVVADLFAGHARGESVPQTIDFATGIVTLDDGWPAAVGSAEDRLARADQIAGPTQLGERRTVETLDPDALVIVVTTEGFFDDSVFGVRLTIDFVNETIGWAQTCQPDRGQQDYQSGLCV